MGKARILSAQGEGLYSIEILEDRTRAEAARTTAVQRVAQLDARITDLEASLSGWQEEVDLAAAVQDEEIADYQTALADDEIDAAAAKEDMLAAAENLQRIAGERDAIRGHIRAAKAERLTLQARIERIDALPPLRQVSAWCADYVEDLAGEVATAEVPGEIGQVIIQPGFSDGAAWSPSEDGAIQPALSGTPASVFYNLAMMPGWQRWRPNFRIATISNIDNDLCSISLDAATSSQQGLNVNAQGSYAGVPIMYMDCNGDAFEDGDRVLVAFSGNTNQPMVVGFEQEPKECGLEFYTRRQKWFDDYQAWGYVGVRDGFVHALLFDVTKGFTAEKIMLGNYINMDRFTGVALCSVSGLVIQDILGLMWASGSDDLGGESFIYYIEKCLDTPVPLLEGSRYALLSINADYGNRYEYRTFRYQEFSDAVSKYITVVPPSAPDKILEVDIPSDRDFSDLSDDEIRDAVAAAIPGSTIFEGHSESDNLLPGLGIERCD